MRPARLAALLALAALGTLPLAAAAQWQWVDHSGRRVFSDQAPPPDIPARNILRQPGVRGQPAADTAADPAAGPARPAAAAPQRAASGRDSELEARRKQAEAAEAEKRKALQRELAEAKAENCKRAREGKALLDSGARVMTADAKGERYFLDDAQRTAENQRLQGLIERDCAAQ